VLAALAVAALTALDPAPLAAQAPPEAVAPAPVSAEPTAGERLALHAYTLLHQSATDAVELVRPLLSPRGTVELQPGTNTLVVRDSLAALARIVPLLRSYDHPAEAVRIEILVVRASRVRVSPPVESTVPAEIEQRLRRLLRYETFELVAQADLHTLEGEQVTYEMGDGYAVHFRLGTLLADRRIKLHGFQVSRKNAPETRSLVHTNLNLWLDQPVTLALARSEASPSALMVMVTCRSSDAAVLQQRTAEGAGGRAAGGG
jgi:hypothetical protein